MGESGNRGIDVARASEASLDPEGLRRAFGLLESWIDEGVLPGAAALVARGGRIAGEAYLGVANRAKEQPVTSDTIWSLASVTKPFTATAVMILVERGVISLDDPLYRLVPAFLRAPTTAFDRRLVTVRHLLAHCSGLPGFSPDNTALRQEHRPLEDFVRSFGSQPLFFTPGAFHLYSNSGILMAAEVVGRAVAGALGVETDEPLVGRYHPFVDEEILAPLGMTLSALRPPAAWDNRIAWVERTGQEGLDWEGANSTYYRSLGIPWGGMFSRPRDLVRFVDLFLPRAGGRQRIGLDPESAIDAPRIVSPATAHEMISIQHAPPDAPAHLASDLRDAAARTPPFAAVELGIGWEVKGTKRPHPSGELTSSATYIHRGATGTMVWADPRVDVACVLLTNRTLVSGWTTERPRQAMFSNAVMAAVR